MHHLRHALSLLALSLACGDNTPADPTGESASSSSSGSTTADPTSEITTSEPTPTTGAAETSGGPDIAALYDCEESDFQSSPLMGPLFDANSGGIQGPLQTDYVLHTTQIYIKPGSVQAFDELAGQIAGEAAATEGLIAFSVGGDNGCGVARTIGIWASEEAMYKLVASPVHAKAMGMTLDLTYTGRVTHWTATAEEANAYTWAVARAKIATVEPSPIY